MLGSSYTSCFNLFLRPVPASNDPPRRFFLKTHIYTLMAGASIPNANLLISQTDKHTYTHTAIGSNLAFGIFPKDTSACSLEELEGSNRQPPGRWTTCSTS